MLTTTLVQRIETAWCPLDNLKEILKVYSNRYEKLTLSSHMDILGADWTLSLRRYRHWSVTVCMVE
jgi:hypothetical protein